MMNGMMVQVIKKWEKNPDNGDLIATTYAANKSDIDKA